MCQGLTIKKLACKNKQAPYCHFHKNQKVQQRSIPIPHQFVSLTKLLPDELALHICSYLPLSLTERLPIKTARIPQKLIPVIHSPLHKTCNNSIMICLGLDKMNNILLEAGFPTPIFHIEYKKRYGRDGHIVKSIGMSLLYTEVSLIILV
jgi:hypothetical protein